MTQNQKRFGLYFISMLTAYGLGNIWRFPYLVFEYGKGSFLLLFCFLCFFIGVPLIVTEILLGKSIQERDYESPIHLLKSVFQNPKASLFWWFPTVVSVMVMSYYTLISCWVLHYVSRLFYSQVTKSGFATNQVFVDLMNRPILLVLLCSVHVLIIYLFLNKGEKLNYKKWTSGVIPILTILMGYIAYRYFTFDDMFETAKTLLYPNFFMLKKESLNFAIGQMLFTLSLGFGTLIGIGKHLNSEVSSTALASRLGLTDSLISILLLAAIFPMVINTEYQGSGSEILFYVIPGYFSEHGLSLFMANSLYLLIYLCSLTASLGLAESVSSNIYESSRLSKSKSHIFSCLVVFLISSFFVILAELSEKIDMRHFGLKTPNLNVSQVVVLVDDILINFLLPISVIIGLQAAIIKLDKNYVKEEFAINEGVKTWPYYLYWKFIIRIGFPLVFLFSVFIRFSV